VPTAIGKKARNAPSTEAESQRGQVKPKICNLFHDCDETLLDQLNVCVQQKRLLLYCLNKSNQKMSGLLCHYCGHSQSLSTSCRKCGGEDNVVLRGPGVEKIAEEVATFLPQSRVEIMSSDHITSPRKLGKLITALEAREIDILIGTQMVAKGHHFPHLTCVGILDGDAGFHTLDFRGPERMMQMLTQVSGRAGRGQRPGHVYIQTHTPNTPLLQTLLGGDQETWVREERDKREQYGWPPSSRLAALILSSASVEKGQGYATRLGAQAPLDPTIQVWGPIPAPLFKIRDQYRWRFLIRGPKTRPLQPFLTNWMKACPPPSSVRLIPDMDPYQFL
jgi:primosomal protein N' (replication factor Y)